mmetsp:Transcript_4788/g.15570  ORF Transcript_4788/g.15570 Transcript_4788/m.15570 type:complete len:373 (+) Transcript_4788:458-1576(+)
MPYRSSGSPSNLWWSRAVGPLHLISLSSYAATEAGSLQHAWLRRDLAAIDRAATPWVIVMMHAPWYNSNSGHAGEAELMRRDLEPLLFEAGVDLVLSGHVHAYERSRPVYDGCSHPCGPVYLNLGDGGNRESAYVPWREPQPAWSAFRESSFGVGLLTLVNETHARFNWTRAACASLDAAEGHVDWDHRHCFTRTHYGEDNSATRLADTDGAWLVRSADRSCSQPAEGACDPAVPPAAPPPPPPHASPQGDTPFPAALRAPPPASTQATPARPVRASTIATATAPTPTPTPMAAPPPLPLPTPQPMPTAPPLPMSAGFPPAAGMFPHPSWTGHALTPEGALQLHAHQVALAQAAWFDQLQARAQEACRQRRR